MAKNLSRRTFIVSSLAASAVSADLSTCAQSSPAAGAAPAASPLAPNALPAGTIAGRGFSRLMMGGNLIGGWAHSRDLSYVSMLMRRYNSPSKVRETLELGEINGITAINTWVMDDNTQIFEHWKAGGKMQW